MPITKRIKVGISAGFYSAAAASALGALVWGWKSPSFQALFFDINDTRSPSGNMVLIALQIFHLLIVIQFSIRRICTKEGLTTPARKNNPESIPPEPLSELKDVPKCYTDIGVERPSTASTSKRALTGDSDDPKKLYAFSLSEIQLGKKEGKGAGGTIYTHSSIDRVDMKREVSSNSDETWTSCRTGELLLPFIPADLKFAFNLTSQLTLPLETPLVPTFLIYPRLTCAPRALRGLEAGSLAWPTPPKILLPRGTKRNIHRWKAIKRGQQNRREGVVKHRRTTPMGGLPQTVVQY